jgi:hypothetical protein
MKTLRRYHNQRVMLLMAGILLAAQTIMFWHSHHGSAAPDEHCQICLHAQHHTPATNSLLAPVLALFSPIAISQTPSSETFHHVYQITLPARAPPAISFT